MDAKRYFVAGIGTDVGKTVVSAVLVEALKADYWKPVQAGDVENTDRMKVQQLVSNTESTFHPERYLLPYPLSPHASAAMAGVEVDANAIQIPDHKAPLIIEGAGGLLVPINYNALYIDWVKRMQLEVILVSRHYLGSINHTLLSAEALKSRGIKVKGIIFNGDENNHTESVILQHTRFDFLGRIEDTNNVSKNFIAQQAQRFTHL
ncbi:MAG: dethiobiotin synthase [Bacteroidia bacterium]|jgi:dethiobiotin synthetase